MKISRIIHCIFLVFLTLSFNSCKKGENDPFLSLKSRDSRITGTWELTNLTASQVDFSNAFGNYTNTTTNTFINDTLTRHILTTHESGVLLDSIDSFYYTLSIELDKSDNSIITENYLFSNLVNSYTGTWSWLNGTKNKSKLHLDNTNIQYFKNTNFEIDRLTNKELILKFSSQHIWNDASGIYRSENTIDEIWTFKKK